MDITESVDFDFFDTPRCDNNPSPQSKKNIDKKPFSPTSAHRQKKDGDADRSHNVDRKKKYSEKDDDSMSSESDLSSSDTDSVTPRDKTKNRNKRYPDKKSRDSSTESSSAYSNSDYSSDENEKEKQYRRSDKKEKLNVHMPRAHVEAWNDENSDTGKQGKQLYESSDTEEDIKHDSNNKNGANRGKTKSSKDKQKKYNGKKKLLRSSSSYSNNSDITDVSPLESPEVSPRHSKVHKHDSESKESRVYKDVQYSDTNVNHSINLESDEIDLSILMKCMADIDKEKQQRLKANSRRVMFAQPSTGGSRNSKGNYTFSMGQAKLIEKENQRLLKKIMNQMTGTSKKAADTLPRQRGPKRVTEPVVQRLTPSAVNRMREQRRIEEQNMQMLNRLQSVKPSKGMSRSEQINEAERQMSYGIPGGTLIVKGDDTRYETRSHRSLHSSMSQTAESTQRSRPSSAKSNTSFVVGQGKRSRPSSAKSNASIRSNASVRSNASRMSGVSVRSNFSTSGVRRMADGRIDKRPVWDDRFSFS